MDNVAVQIVLSAIEAWAEMLNLAAWKPQKRLLALGAARANHRSSRKHFRIRFGVGSEARVVNHKFGSVR
jgi:hypothetical protein